MLADLGAEVIKIERPGSGDDTRSWGPPYMPDQKGDATTESAYFHGANRGKQSVCIDMSQAQGQALIQDLVLQSDVLIENFKVGGLKKYALDFASLHALNPRLVYCSITGFGQSGPYAERAGYDFMIQAMGGMMSITGEADGLPMKTGVAIADILTGLYAANAIQAALMHQQKTGAGQHIDLALLDVQVATLASQAMNYLSTGTSPARLGNAHPNIVPYQAFETSDGYIILAVGNDSQFRRFCELAGKPELADDERFQKNRGRVENREALVLQVKEIMLQKSGAEWLEALNARGIPCGPINNIEQVFADPQVQYRGMQLELDHPTAGKVASVASPIRLSQTPIEYQQAPPLLGQHTDDVLSRLLTLDNAAITRLRNDGIVA
jgi:crotonobetainyl-CoA:carnitine CoA-transferase CaiB-like acyl-CoA transferase